MKMKYYMRLLGKLMKIKYDTLSKKPVIPYKYVFLTTNLCQSMCRTCNIWKIYRENPELIKMELNSREYGKIFKSIRYHALWINFSGGEPFLKNEIDKIILKAAKTIKTLFIINIPTNGLAVSNIINTTEKILDRMPTRVHLDITVSLDSVKRDLYKAIRGVDGLSRVIKTYNTLKELTKKFDNFSVNYQMTISKFNVNDIKTINYILKNSEMPIFTFSYENEYFNNIGLNVSIKKIFDKEFEDTLKYIIKEYPVRNIRSIIPKTFLILAEKYFKKPYRQIVKCTSLRSTITIDPYGNVLPCSYFYSKIGNLRNFEYDIPKFIELKNNLIEKYIEIIEKNKCPVCWTNCEAFPSMFLHPIETFLRFFGL